MARKQVTGKRISEMRLVLSINSKKGYVIRAKTVLPENVPEDPPPSVVE